MTVEDSWLTAFPIPQAAEAVTALCESWRAMANVRRPNFHPGTKEPHLTRVLKDHVERVTARERGILGMWAAEAVQNETNFYTGKLIDERRTDIVYGWNDEKIGIQLIFEVKKIDRLSGSQRQYLGKNGLGRFVSGIYGRGQPIAVMIGILTDPEDQVVPKLIQALSDPNMIATLRLRLRADGEVIEQPSRLFQEAKFDTEHERDEKPVSSRNIIRIAHLFLEFGYKSS